MHSLKYRSAEREKLDDLNLSGKKLEQSLRQLAYINRGLGNTRSILYAIKNLTPKNCPKTLRIIDLGCGGGDILIQIEKQLRKKALPYQLVGIDGNPNSLAFARRQAGKSSQIEFLCQDIMANNFQLNDCDILLSSHFIYHFEEAQLIHFLQKHKKNIHSSILFSELRRNKLAYLLFRTFSRILGFNKIVREDGTLAIRRAYTKSEMEDLLSRSGIHSFQVQNKWLFRMLIYLNPKNL